MAYAQPDSTAKAIEDTWMQPRSDGRLSHDLPPPGNVVTAGYAIHHKAITARDAWWLRLGGAAVGAVFYAADAQHRLGAPLAIAGACFTYSIVLDFRGNKSLNYAGDHLRSGYNVHTRYDIIPDSEGQGPHVRLLLQPTSRMSRHDRLELERAKREVQQERRDTEQR